MDGSESDETIKALNTGLLRSYATVSGRSMYDDYAAYHALGYLEAAVTAILSRDAASRKSAIANLRRVIADGRAALAAEREGR